MARKELNDDEVQNVAGGNIGWDFVTKNEFYVKDSNGNILKTYKANNTTGVIEAFNLYYSTREKTEAEFIDYLIEQNLICQ